jgi:BirA family biotin operon repressor/biotin-[acetyl-CoA-carboxylase] ligase
MRIIKLNATDSTNGYLRRICSKKGIEDYTVVMAKNQTKGRGQMGTVWNSQPSKNLTVSVFKDVSFIDLDSHFFISIVTSLAIIKTLRSFSVPKLSIKWPNDILSEDQKICGILIENVIKQNNLNASIIGIGLNVNQALFKDLPKASSLKLITGAFFNLDEVLHEIITHLKYYFLQLKQGNFNELKIEYESFLFRKDKPSTFKDNRGTLFSGFIKTITDSGSLQVLLEDDVLKEFDLKEITLLY